MNAVPPVPTSAWRQSLLALLVIETALIVLYFDTGRTMVGIWARSGTFNHAFLVPPIAIWLIWQRRHVLARYAPRPAPWLAMPFALSACGWLLGDVAAVNALTQFAFVALLVLAVPLVIGVPAARLIAFPLGFLFFAVPFGEFVMPKLMEWTAYFAVAGLRASGVPVYQEGLHFVIPSGRWSVVEACSGVRYLIASLVVGTLYAYLNYQSLKRRLVFVGVAILVPLVANWVRAYLIVMLGHLSGNRIAVGVDHLIYGWVFFGIVMMIMFAIGLRWREAETEPVVVTAAPVTAGAAPVRLLPVVVLALALGLAPRAASVAFESGPAMPAPVLATAPLAAAGWRLVEEPFITWQPVFAHPTATLAATLSKDERKVGIFIAYYRQQNYTSKLISSENALVKSNDPDWAQVESAQQPARIGGQVARVRSALLRSGPLSPGGEAQRFLVWHWYWIDDDIVTSDALGKLKLALARLMGRGDASAAVFAYAVEPGAQAALADYLAAAGDGIASVLKGAVPPPPTIHPSTP